MLNWINANDAVPADDTKVIVTMLCYQDSETYREVTLCHRHEGSWALDGRNEACKVEAWMPIPEIYNPHKAEIEYKPLQFRYDEYKKYYKCPLCKNIVGTFKGENKFCGNCSAKLNWDEVT